MSKLTFEDSTYKTDVPVRAAGFLLHDITIIHGVHLAEALRWRDANVENPKDGEQYLVVFGDAVRKRTCVAWRIFNESLFWVDESIPNTSVMMMSALPITNTMYRPLIEWVDTPE